MGLSIFVASSTEGEAYAGAIQWILSDYEVTVWSQGTFKVSHLTLEDLFRAAKTHDFGVFVFTPDDRLTIGGKKHPDGKRYLGGKKYQAARDNVLFELGLFMGMLGKERTIFIKPKFSEPELDNFRVPTDLQGIASEYYNPTDSDLRRAVGRACQTIKERAAELGRRHPDPSTAPSHVSPIAPSHAQPCATAPKLREILDAERAIKMGAAPPSRFVNNVMQAIVELAREVPARGTVNAQDIVQTAGLLGDVASVLCCCEHFEQWGVLVHRERDSVWSADTPLSFVDGDEKDRHGSAYWRGVLSRGQNRMTFAKE